MGPHQERDKGKEEMTQMCKCGKIEEITTGGNLDRYTIHDSITGELIYAVCPHGFAYIDKRKTATFPPYDNDGQTA
jgi:hypothetical protein